MMRAAPALAARRADTI
ncbi:hypothetical protein A2U01_0085345, partial [Trifolium medium]|nr:hypothetical protein [Trifolium medium]